MKKKINRILTLTIVILLLPLLVTIMIQRMRLEKLMGQAEGSEIFLQQEIQKQSEEPEMEIDIDMSRLVGIVAKEIDINSEPEAMKAQIVIARTNLLLALEKGTEEPVGFSVEEMQDMWGDAFKENYAYIEALIESTERETLQYQEDYIYAAYHAVSAGVTRNMAEMFAESKMPYLTSVDCHEDTTAHEYIAVYYWEAQEFIELCKEKYPQSSITTVDDVRIAKKDSNGYVLELQIGQSTDSGENFRNMLELNSAHFSIANIDGNVRIVTKGLGHGLGLSQYTAEKMAEEGKDYKEILTYFFPETEIV